MFACPTYLPVCINILFFALPFYLFFCVVFLFFLQVFASIQTQVLVKDPYYNEGDLRALSVPVHPCGINHLNIQGRSNSAVLLCTMYA